jgi:hypothetical protein
MMVLGRRVKIVTAYTACKGGLDKEGVIVAIGFDPKEPTTSPAVFKVTVETDEGMLYTSPIDWLVTMPTPGSQEDKR